MTFSMILGDKLVKSSNHHALLEQGLIDSGVLIEEEDLNPDAISGEEEEEEEEFVRPESEFAVIFARRAEMNL